MNEKECEKIFIYLIVFLLIGLGSISTINSDTIKEKNDYIPTKLNPIEDSFINEHNPDDNYGNWEALEIRGLINWRINSLIKFNLSSFSSAIEIKQAKLHLYYYQNWDGNPSGHTINIHRIEETWNESLVTWNNQPSHNNSISNTAIIPSFPGFWMEWDITSDVQDFIDGSKINYGWKIIDTITNSNDVTYFYSKEFGTLSPYLEIEYANIYVDGDADPSWYDATHVRTIQEGIDNASSGDTIYVFNGLYYENVVINKTINLIGESRDNVIIDGSGNKVHIMDITADYVDMKNFTIRNSRRADWHDSGLWVNSENSSFSNLHFTDCMVGMTSDGSINIQVTNCISHDHGNYAFLFLNGTNIQIQGCVGYNTPYKGIMIHGNNYTVCDCDVWNTWGALRLAPANNCNIYNNTFHNSRDGIKLLGSDNNLIFENTIYENSEAGIYVKITSYNNLIYHNTIFNNTQNALDSCSNDWNDSYPSGGNYWDNYTGLDNFHGQNQDIPGGDGIGDTPYDISNGSNQDLYPLMQPWGEEPGPIAIWHFDEGTGSTAYDSSGNGNHGTINGASWVNGMNGTALEFDGLDDYVEVPDNNSLDFGNNSFSVSCWISTLHQDKMVLFDKDLDDSGNPSWHVKCNKDSTGEIRFVTGGQGTDEIVSTIENYYDGQWHFLVFVRDVNQNKQYIYYDGSLSNQTDIIVRNISNSEPLYLSDNGNDPYHGFLDEVNIFNQVLTANEIQTIYESTRPTPTIVHVDDDYTNSTPGWQYDHFGIIQEGIDAVAENGTVFVFNGTYFENVIVNSSMDLIGESNFSTIIDGIDFQDDLIIIQSKYVSMSNFTIRNGGLGTGKAIIHLSSNSSFCDFNNLKIYNCYRGILVKENSNYCNFSNNYIYNTNKDGIRTDNVNNNTISNNRIENIWGTSIITVNSDFINITNNNCQYSGYTGIDIDNCSKCLINKNYLTNNGGHNLGALYIRDGSNHINVTYNKIINNFDEGIFLTLSDYITIYNNDIVANSHDGIQFSSSSNNMIIKNNISGNSDGMDLHDFNNNTISNNNIISNNDEGIDLINSNNNLIFDNLISNNIDNGIELWDSTNNNILYHNTLIENNINAQDAGTNIWDNGYPSGGNYWSDYTGTDDDGDGIGDTPYDIPGGSNQDNYPFGPFHPIADYTFSPTNPTRLDVIQFTDSSFDPDGTIVNWSWSFGDGYGSSIQNPTHQYTDLGTYLVNLTVWDNENNSNSTQQLISVVNMLPIADFNYTPLYPEVNETISFSDISYDLDGNITSWLWEFGDGYSSTLQNPIYDYHTSGLFEVVLTVTDNDVGSSTVGEIVAVSTPLHTLVNLSSGWNLISVPFNNSIAFEDFIIKQNDSLCSWYAAIADWNPAGTPILNPYAFGWNRQGQFYTFTNALNPGFGCWLYAYQDCQLLVEEFPLNPDTYITTLESGWNLVGNPHQPPHDITMLLFEYLGSYYDWTEATTDDNPTNSPLINPYIFGWNSNQYYEFATEFIAGEAYWVYAFTQCDMNASTWS